MIAIAPLAGLCPISVLIVCIAWILVALIGVLRTLVKEPRSLELVLNRFPGRRAPSPTRPPENGSE